MRHPSEFSALPDWSAVPNDSAEDRSLLNQRIAYFGRVLCLLSFTGTIMEICLKHVHEPAEPLASRSRQPVPAALDALVLSCLEKDPRQRPASASALRKALGELELGAAWTDADADIWWAASAPAALASARARHASRSDPPGPQTLAIDWAARHAATAEA